MSKKDKKQEGQRINHFIHKMRHAGCTFNSGQIPIFMQRGSLEFWEGEFFYKPGRLPLIGKVTLDHNFITMKTARVVPKEKFQKFREELHLLMTANQCHYYVEPVPDQPENLFLNVAKYIYAELPPGEEVHVVLDMLAHGVFDLEKALSNNFKDWQPRLKI